MSDNQRYFTLLTDKGKFKIAKAAANKSEVKLTHFAIGDGNGQEVNPSPTQTALVNEVWRTQLDSVEIDPQNPAAVIINAIIPHSAGGWWMREFGLFDIDGDMLAVVKPAPYYKATSAEGQLEDIFYEFQLVIGEQAEVVVLVDPSILWATREYVETRRISAAQLMNTPWLPIKALNIVTPPTNTLMGDTYIIPSSAKGDWSGKVGQLAEWNGKEWKCSTTPEGHGIGLPDGRVFIKTNGAYVEKIALDTQSGKWNYAEAAGTGDALTVMIEPKPYEYIDGMIIVLTLKKTSTTKQPTINLNNLGVCNIVNPDGSNLSVGALVANTKIVLVYDKRLNAFCALTSTKQPGQAVGFFAYGTKGATLPTGALTQVKIGPTIRFDTNESYSVDTGLFTCPFDGLYTFSFSFWFDDISLQTWVFIGLNNTMVAETSVNSRGRVLSVSTNLMLKKGDKVGTYVRQAGSTMTIPNDPKQFYYAFSAISNGM